MYQVIEIPTGNEDGEQTDNTEGTDSTSGGSGNGSGSDRFDDDDRPKKYYVGDVCVKVLSERVQYVRQRWEVDNRKPN